MTNKEIIEFAKKGKENAKMVIFTEGGLLSYLSGISTMIELENKKIKEEENDISVRYMIKLSSLWAKLSGIKWDELRIETIKLYLVTEKELKKVILKYKPELNNEILKYFKGVREMAYDGEDYDEYSLTLLN